MGSSMGKSVFSPNPNFDLKLISSILSIIDASQRIAWTQHAALRSVAVPNVSISGAGITYLLFAAPPRIGD
jgi:hypothetical protein